MLFVTLHFFRVEKWDFLWLCVHTHLQGNNWLTCWPMLHSNVFKKQSKTICWSTNVFNKQADKDKSNRFRIYLSLNLFGWNLSFLCPNLILTKKKNIGMKILIKNLRVIITWKKPISCLSLQRLSVCFQLAAGRACFHQITATTQRFDWRSNNRGFCVCVCVCCCFLSLRYSAGWRLRGESAQRGPQRQNSGQH